jgi:hypothetical protein
MNVYRLDPIDPDHPVWKLSTEQDTIWASAQTEEAARDLVASRSGFNAASGETSPWKNPAVTSCTLDSTMKLLNPGDVIRGDGSQLTN